MLNFLKTKGIENNKKSDKNYLEQESQEPKLPEKDNTPVPEFPEQVFAQSIHPMS